MQRTILSEWPVCFNHLRTTEPMLWKNESTSILKIKLCETDLYGTNAVSRPLMRTQNNVKRLQWAKAHKDWTIEQWNKVLWTDESNFEIFRLNRRLRVCERAATSCIIQTMNHGRGFVLVCGYLYLVKGKLNQMGYHNILQHYVIPSGTQLVFLLMQDNDPEHTSTLCQRYIKSKEE